MVTCLRGHTGLVKGLTWDPVGKYIASQADDHSLKVWRTLDWQMEANITKPFNEVTFTRIGDSNSPVSIDSSHLICVFACLKTLISGSVALKHGLLKKGRVHLHFVPVAILMLE